MLNTNVFFKESKRKELLLDSMIKLSEKHLKALYKSGGLKEAYDGVAEVVSIYDEKVKLFLLGIEMKVSVQMGQEVCQFLKKKDQLILSLGKTDSFWCLMDIDMVISPMSNSSYSDSTLILQKELNQSHRFH